MDSTQVSLLDTRVEWELGTATAPPPGPAHSRRGPALTGGSALTSGPPWSGGSTRLPARCRTILKENKQNNLERVCGSETVQLVRNLHSHEALQFTRRMLKGFAQGRRSGGADAVQSQIHFSQLRLAWSQSRWKSPCGCCCEFATLDPFRHRNFTFSNCTPACGKTETGTYWSSCSLQWGLRRPMHSFTKPRSPIWLCLMAKSCSWAALELRTEARSSQLSSVSRHTGSL